MNPNPSTKKREGERERKKERERERKKERKKEILIDSGFKIFVKNLCLEF
jgi:hypothetical protein